jgi:hypothetical protein
MGHCSEWSGGFGKRRKGEKGRKVDQRNYLDLVAVVEVTPRVLLLCCFRSKTDSSASSLELSYASVWEYVGVWTYSGDCASGQTCHVIGGMSTQRLQIFPVISHFPL